MFWLKRWFTSVDTVYVENYPNPNYKTNRDEIGELYPLRRQNERAIRFSYVFTYVGTRTLLLHSTKQIVYIYLRV